MKKTLRLLVLCTLIMSMLTTTLVVTAAEEEEKVWEPKADMLYGTYYFSAEEVGGKIYTFGGYQQEARVSMYDPSTNTWTAMTNMMNPAYGHCSAVVDGKIYIFGGINHGNKVSVFDPSIGSTGGWTSKSNMTENSYYSATAVMDGKIYLAGGTQSQKTFKMYDPINDTWTTLADMNIGRSGLNLETVNGKIYAIASELTSGNKSIEVYDSATNQWTEKATIPEAAGFAGTVVVGNSIYIIGGGSGSAKTLIYDTVNDTWSEGPALQIARFGHESVLVDNAIYTFGGDGFKKSLEVLNAVNSTSSKNQTITITSAKSKVKIGEEFTVDVVLNNAEKIYAEDIKLTYDINRFEFVGYENVTGLQVYNQQHESTTGAIRTIVASLGENYAINGNQSMFQLKFKAIAKGDGLIDSTAGRIANVNEEWDIEELNCGDITITVEGYQDVNRTGEFTLVDLAIDAFYYNNFVAVDTTKHDADVVMDSKINDLDLNAIVSEMLANANYAPNK